MLTKLIHFVKMSWMFIWRLLLVSSVFLGGQNVAPLIWAAIAASAFSVFVLNRALMTWPIARLLLRKPLIVPANGWGSNGETAPSKGRPQSAPRTGRPVKPQVAVPTGPQLQTATENGRITGFEPHSLEVQPVPKLPTMIGAPGSGLHGATGMTQTNISLGVKGEENFARALRATGQLGRFTTIWSVPVPDQDRFVPGPFGTDIDCIVATESAIFLVDLKNYKSGNVRYYADGNQLYCEDVPTGQQVGDPKTMSRNMEMATSAVRKHFPTANVVPVVVFMPTDKGEGVLENVVWPGGVPAMNLTEFLSVLANQRDFSWSQPHGGIVGRLGNLLTMGVSKV